MHRLVKAAITGTGAGLLLAATLFVPPVSGQAPPARDGGTALISAVLRFRLYWLEDRTQFDACSLYVQAGRPARFPEGIPSDLRDLVGPLADGLESCGQPSSGASAPTRMVLVHSVAQADTTAQVRLYVRKGDQSHIEDYTLRRLLSGEWDVADVRMWGRLYVHPPRQRG